MESGNDAMAEEMLGGERNDYVKYTSFLWSETAIATKNNFEKSPLKEIRKQMAYALLRLILSSVGGIGNPFVFYWNNPSFTFSW